MFKNKKYEISILEFPILLLKVKEGEILEVSDAIEMQDVFLTFSKGKKFAVLLDAVYAFNVEAKAMELIASKEYASKRIGSAIVTKSLANKLVGNFFIKAKRPGTPTKIFTNYDEALQWLRDLVQKA